MAITVLPRAKSGIEEFNEALQPYLQLAMANAIKKNQAKQEFEQNMLRARTAQPGLFAPMPDMVPTPRGFEKMPGVTGGQMPVKPSIHKNYQFLANKAQPGTEFNASTGELSYKAQQPDFFSQYLKMQGVNDFVGKGESKNNLIYRDTSTGEEVPQDIAKSNIEKGKQYDVYKKTITKSGVKEEQVVKSKESTADIKNAIKSTQQAKTLVNNLVKQSESLKGGYSGMAEIAKGAINRGKGESSNYRLYLSNLPSASVSIYRAVTGDTRLSDADAQARAYPMMWHPSEDIDTRKKKNDYIKSMVSARELLLKSNNFTSDENGNAITDFSMVTSLADKISRAKDSGYLDEEIQAYIMGQGE